MKIILLFIINALLISACTTAGIVTSHDSKIKEDWTLWEDVDSKEFRNFAEFDNGFNVEKDTWIYFSKEVKNGYIELSGEMFEFNNGSLKNNCTIEHCISKYAEAKGTVISQKVIGLPDGEESEMPIHGLSNAIYIERNEVKDPKNKQELVQLFMPYDNEGKVAKLLFFLGYGSSSPLKDEEIGGRSSLIKPTETGFTAILIEAALCHGYKYVQIDIEYTGLIRVSRTKDTFIDFSCVI